ncbi:hypothetical protein [Nocardia sp. MW-W600-9]
MTTKKPNPVVKAAAARTRKPRKPAPTAPVPTPGQLPLFSLDDLTEKANR